jgi:hypothetical protein
MLAKSDLSIHWYINRSAEIVTRFILLHLLSAIDFEGRPEKDSDQGCWQQASLASFS